MAISFELPQEIERNLRRELGDLDQAAKVAALVELYRQHRLKHHEFAVALGLSRFQADALLKEHGVSYDVSFEEISSESRSLRLDSKP